MWDLFFGNQDVTQEKSSHQGLASKLDKFSYTQVYYIQNVTPEGDYQTHA